MNFLKQILGENGMYTNRVQNTNKKFVCQKTTYKSSDPGIQRSEERRVGKEC